MKKPLSILAALAAAIGLIAFDRAEAGGGLILHNPTPSPIPLLAQDSDPDIYAIEVQGGPDFWVVSGVSAGDRLNIRSGPGTGNRVIARAPNGTVLRNLGCRGSGSSRWCKVEPRNGGVRGWAKGSFLRESGGGSAGGGAMDMRGVGTVTLGGPLIGQIISKNGRSYALILTATKDRFTCTGSFKQAPGSRESMSATIHCTNGSSGSAILKGGLLTFSAGGKGGYVRFR